MATAKEKSEISLLQADVGELKTDVALLKQSNQKVIEPALQDIKNTLSGFSFVTTKEFELYKEEVKESLGARSFKENLLSGTFGSLLTAVVLFVFNFFIHGGK